MTRRRATRRVLGRSLGFRLGAVVLACVALLAVFAELVAADAPWLSLGPRGLRLFPGVTQPDSYRGLAQGEIAERHAADSLVWWPLVRSGPRTVAAVGPAAPPSRAHPLGTDSRGHDVLARLVYGARSALGMTAATLALSLLLGGVLGAAAGYAGGAWDELLARPVELVETFPTVIVVAVARAVDPQASMWSLVLAVAAVRWAEVARLVRAEVIKTCAQDFVTAARALGCSHFGVLWRHVLPHAARPVIVSLMFGVASLVLLEVAVSFLGIGVPGSWGVLIAEGLEPRAPLWGSGCAAVALALTVGAAYLMADALGEAIDPRTR